MKISELKVRQGNVETEGEIMKKKNRKPSINSGKKEKSVQCYLTDDSGRLN